MIRLKVQGKLPIMFITLHNIWYFPLKISLVIVNKSTGKFRSSFIKEILNPFSANPTKWTNTPKQFVCNSRRNDWVRLVILWDWRLKGYRKTSAQWYRRHHHHGASGENLKKSKGVTKKGKVISVPLLKNGSQYSGTHLEPCQIFKINYL